MLKRFTFAVATIGSTLNLVLATASIVNANVTYQIDDGKSETAFGIIDRNCQTEVGKTWGDLFWLNSFSAQSGGEVIYSISVGLGTPAPIISSGSAECDPARPVVTDSGLTPSIGRWAKFLLFSDPNNDGNPDDAQLLSSVDALINLPGFDETGRDLFTTVLLPETLVTGNFFIGALFFDQQEGQFPAAIDISAPKEGRSWAAFRQRSQSDQANVPSPIDVTDLAFVSTDDFVTGANDNGDPIVGGNWLLRANGKRPAVRQVPEADAAVGLLILGSVGLAGLKRRWI